MTRVPSERVLLDAFRDLTPERAKLIRALAHATNDPVKLSSIIHGNASLARTAAYAKSCYGDPFDSPVWRRTMMLHAVDVLLETHGVEPLGEVDMRRGPPYEYCNAGDSYATTLIYFRDADALRIGSWGDLVEHLERRGVKFA